MRRRFDRWRPPEFVPADDPSGGDLLAAFLVGLLVLVACSGIAAVVLAWCG